MCIESQIGHIRLADLETSRGYGHPQVLHYALCAEVYAACCVSDATTLNPVGGAYELAMMSILCHLRILLFWLSTVSPKEQASLCGASLGAALFTDDGDMQVHNRSALGMNCVRAVQRRRGASLVPEDVEVGAVRVSVTGWDGWVLEGLRVRLSLTGILRCLVILPASIAS